MKKYIFLYTFIYLVQKKIILDKMIDYISAFGCVFIVIILILFIYVLRKDCKDKQIYPVATPAFVGGIPMATEINKNHGML